MSSDRFTVHKEGTYAVVIPDDVGNAFAKAGHARATVKAFFKENEFDFNGKTHILNGQCFISFRKRYQKAIGVFSTDFFQLHPIEDTSK